MSFAGESNSSRGAGPSAIDQAAASVLASSEILLSAPNNAKLHALYPTPAECTSTIAQMVCNSGQIRVTSNSKSFGGVSNFHISSASILDPPVLNVTLPITIASPVALTAASDLPIGVAPCGDGWLFQLISSIEVTFSNSNLSNLILRKESLREWTLAQCRGREEREELLRNAGSGRLVIPTFAGGAVASGVAVFTASLPLSFLSWQGANVDSGFGFDARTVNGIIQLQINWEPNVYKAFSLFRLRGGFVNAGQTYDQYSTKFKNLTLAAPAFSDIFLSFRSYQLMDSTFSVANALATDPYLKYALPGKWVNSYKIELVGERVVSSKPWGELLPAGLRPSDATRLTMELTSAPAGMLQAIGIHVRPIGAKASSALGFGQGVGYPYPYGGTGGDLDKVKVNYAESLALDSIRLQYSGQNIIQLNSKKEIDAYMKFIYGDDFTYYSTAPLPNPSASCGTSTALDVDYTGSVADAAVALLAARTTLVHNSQTRGYGKRKGQIYLLPLMHNGRQVFQERHFENLPQYSGSTLTLEITALDDTPYQTPFEPATPWTGAVAATNAANARFKDAGTLYNTIIGGGALNPTIDVPIPPIDVLTQEAEADNVFNIVMYDRYEVIISYYVASLLVNSNGMVELQI